MRSLLVVEMTNRRDRNKADERRKDEITAIEQNRINNP